MGQARAKHPCQEFNGEQNRVPALISFQSSRDSGGTNINEMTTQYAIRTLESALKEKHMRGFWGSNVWAEIWKML